MNLIIQIDYIVYSENLNLVFLQLEAYMQAAGADFGFKHNHLSRDGDFRGCFPVVRPIARPNS